MFKTGDIISYLEMCQEEKVNLQRGMNFRLRDNYSVILMSVRKGAPYADKIEENGSVLIYEGHDAAKRNGAPDPKSVDQPFQNPNGSQTQNGLFFEAANNYKNKKTQAELVKVYEKIRPGIWVYNGIFKLVDAWIEKSNKRKVFKFRLILIEEPVLQEYQTTVFEHDRLIPSYVKIEVWKRDKGCCVKCGRKDNLHFDHIIPYSKGGSSSVSKNIQLLCVRHNLEKRANIE